MKSATLQNYFDDEVKEDKPRSINGRYVGEETLAVRFYKKPIFSSLKSEQEQRPVFEEIDHIEIKVPGDKLGTINTIVNDSYIKRFPNEWNLYSQSGDNKKISGIPLDEWPAITEGQRKELKYFEVNTVEECAYMSDEIAQKFNTGGINLRDKAKQFLALMNDTSLVSKQEKEIEELKKAVESLMQDSKAKAKPKQE